MMFAKPLRARVRSGEITRSVRIWQRPHVKVGGRYPLLDGEIEITWITEIDLSDITEEMARASGFASLEELMAVAKHGRGERAFVVDFRFHPPHGEASGALSGSGG
jgi:hypothetical protein